MFIPLVLISTDPGFMWGRAMLRPSHMLGMCRHRFIRAPTWRLGRCTTGTGIREATWDAATSIAIAGNGNANHTT